METCARRRAQRVAFTVFLLVLNATIVESSSTDADTDIPLSTESVAARTTDLKQTTTWPDRGAAATTVDLEEMTDVPASVSITGARAGKTCGPRASVYKIRASD